MSPSEYLGRRMFHGEATRWVENTRKLLEREQNFTLELMKILVQAIVGSRGRR